MRFLTRTSRLDFPGRTRPNPDPVTCRHHFQQVDGEIHYCTICKLPGPLVGWGPPRPTTPSTKTCSACDRRRSADHFYRDIGRPDGLKPYCKDCYRLLGEGWTVAMVRAAWQKASA